MRLHCSDFYKRKELGKAGKPESNQLYCNQLYWSRIAEQEAGRSDFIALPAIQR